MPLIIFRCPHCEKDFNGCLPITSTLVTQEMLTGLESHLLTGMFTIVSRDRWVPTTTTI